MSVFPVCDATVSLRASCLKSELARKLPWPSPAAPERFFPRPHPSPDALPAAKMDSRNLSMTTGVHWFNGSASVLTQVFKTEDRKRTSDITWSKSKVKWSRHETVQVAPRQDNVSDFFSWLRQAAGSTRHKHKELTAVLILHPSSVQHSADFLVPLTASSVRPWEKCTSFRSFCSSNSTWRAKQADTAE